MQGNWEGRPVKVCIRVRTVSGSLAQLTPVSNSVFLSSTKERRSSFILIGKSKDYFSAALSHF